MVGVLQNGTTKSAHCRPIPKPRGKEGVHGQLARTNIQLNHRRMLGYKDGEGVRTMKKGDNVGRGAKEIS
jgi:hypothetical protein